MPDRPSLTADNGNNRYRAFARRYNRSTRWRHNVIYCGAGKPVSVKPALRGRRHGW